MSTDLGTRLKELAGDTVMTPGRPEELWQRGRTWQRRRNSGVALIVVVTVLVLGGLGGLAWQRGAPPPAPASDSGKAMLTDWIYEPSPWLPGTADTRRRWCSGTDSDGAATTPRRGTRAAEP
jgi:hypothetical protein